ETQPRGVRGQTLPPESLWRPSRNAEDLRVDHSSAADLASQGRTAGRHHLGSAEQVPDVPSSRQAQRDGATSDQEGATVARLAEGVRPNPVIRMEHGLNPTNIPERETPTDRAALRSNQASSRTSTAGPESQAEGVGGSSASKPSLTDRPGTSPAQSALGTELAATLTSGQRARQTRPGQSGTHQARETRTMAAGSELEEKRSERSHSESRLNTDPKAAAASSGSQTTRGHHGFRSESQQSSAAQNGESVQEPDSREMARDAGSRPELESVDGRRKEAEPIRTGEASSRAHETTSVREHFQPVVHSVAATVSRSDPVASSPRVAAGQAPQHAAGTADAGQIFDQIVETAKLDRTIGLDRFTVQLKPGFLGRIEIQTEMSEDAAMHAVIRVEDPTVRKAVETGLAHLVSKLNELGLEIASAKVADFLPQHDGQGQQHSGSGSSSSKGRQFSSTIEGPAGTAGVEENLAAGDDGSVSYFV
ncbi:MAG: flagellar hook-length control protein FliK, partial [Acidobacteriota bacterium]